MTPTFLSNLRISQYNIGFQNSTTKFYKPDFEAAVDFMKDSSKGTPIWLLNLLNGCPNRFMTVILFL